MVSMATTVRPVFLVTLPAVQNIFNLITESQTRRLPQEVRVRHYGFNVILRLKAENQSTRGLLSMPGRHLIS